MTDAATASPDLDPLRSQISGRVSGPGDQDWDEARQAWNLAVDQRPVAVVFATGADDVAATVRFAAEAGVRVTAQGSGHAASSHDTLADTVLIKTNEMNGLEIDAGNRTARVEAGVLAGDLAAQAGEHGLAPLGGSSPDVGVVGYTLGGGLGWLGRAARVRLQRRPVGRGGHGRRASSCGPTRTSSRTCSGPCAAGAARSASSPPWT